MNQLSLFEKVQVLFRLLFSSPIIIGIFVFSLFLMILLFFYSKLNKKVIKYSFIGIYVLIIGFAFFKYGSYFLTSIDSFLTLFMANIYFPTIPVYVAIMIISFIVMIITLSNRKINKFVKIINTVFFTLIQMLFAVFIYIIETNKIDVSSNSNLYTNEQTLVLLELGMGLFVIWMVLLLVIFYLKKADKIFKTNKNDNVDDFDEYINDYNEPLNVGSSNVSSNNISSNNVESNNVESNNVESNNVESNNVESNNVISNNVESNNVESNNVVSNNVSNDIDEEILSFDSDLSINKKFESVDNLDNSFIINKPISDERSVKNKVDYNNNPVDVFNNFNFLDFNNKKVERKNDDVEIIDFD